MPHPLEDPGILDRFEGESAELAINAINSGLNVTVRVHALTVSVSNFIATQGVRLMKM